MHELKRENSLCVAHIVFELMFATYRLEGRILKVLLHFVFSRLARGKAVLRFFVSYVKLER